MHFIAEADMLQERWYWRDEQLLSADRYMPVELPAFDAALALDTGSQPFEGQGLGVALSSSFEASEQAVQSMQRIVRWRIGQVAKSAQQRKCDFAIALSH